MFKFLSAATIRTVRLVRNGKVDAPKPQTVGAVLTVKQQQMVAGGAPVASWKGLR